MLHNSGFCNNYTPKQMLFQTKYHYKKPLARDSYMKSLEFYENYITLFCLEKVTF